MTKIAETSSGHGFLVGPSLYLRAVRLSDVATAPRWYPSLFPLPAPVVEERLKERFDKGYYEEELKQLFIVCRRADDLPVGSVELKMAGWRYADVNITVDPLCSERVQDQLHAEVLKILIPWLLHERNVMTVEFGSLDGMPETTSVARESGARVAARLRDFRLVNGRRRDEFWHQVLHPDWLTKIGQPPISGEGEARSLPVTDIRGGLRVSPEERPGRAIVVGERLYLRPFEPDEGALVEEWALQETDVVFPQGRFVVNQHAYGASHKTWASAEYPEHIRMAIALRSTDELIGAIGLQELDWVNRTAETEMEIFRPEHRGGGLGTEAKHLLLDYGFNQVGLHAVYSFVSETNPRSAAAVRKQGYRDAGYVAWADFGPNGMCGAWVFDLLADEWRTARHRGAGQ